MSRLWISKCAAISRARSPRRRGLPDNSESSSRAASCSSFANISCSPG
jgi:hypothetical protein